jgi:hypothetical protein
VPNYPDLFSLELGDRIDCTLRGNQHRQMHALQHKDGPPTGGGRIVAAHHSQLGVVLAQRLGAGQQACGLEHSQLKAGAFRGDLLLQGRQQAPRFLIERRHRNAQHRGNGKNRTIGFPVQLRRHARNKGYRAGDYDHRHDQCRHHQSLAHVQPRSRALRCKETMAATIGAG